MAKFPLPLDQAARLLLTFVNDKKSRRFLLGLAESALKRALGTDDKSAASKSKPRAGTGDVGVVYLLQAGPYYKVGRTRDITRRTRDIKLQLPFQAELLHLIESDDISRTEAYWHRKFAHRRQNGEWFLLSDAEVAEFKSCRRM